MSPGACKLWPHLDTRELFFPVIVRWLAIPCGAYAAYLADQRLDPAQAKQVIGVFLLTVIILLWGFRISPRDYLHLGWQTLAFSSSGFLMGFAAIGGAPMVIYVNSLTWSANKSRAFLFFCSAACFPIAIRCLLAGTWRKDLTGRINDRLHFTFDPRRPLVWLSPGFAPLEALVSTDYPGATHLDRD